MPHISKSQLEELMSCPRLYYYHRYEGIQGPDSLGAIVGSAYHRSWDEFFKRKKRTGKNRPLDWCQSLFRDEFAQRVKEGVESETLEFEKGEDGKQLDMGIALVEAYFPYAEQIEPLLVEQKYELSIPGHDWTLYGYMDLVYKCYLYEGENPVMDEEGNHKWVAVVVDHKTSGSTPYDQSKPERFEQWAQLNEFAHEAIGYSLAYRALSGKSEDRFEYHYAVKTKTPKVVISPLRFSNRHMNWYMDFAVEQIERIKRGFFERNVTSWKHSPRFCPAWEKCHNIVPDQDGARGRITVV